MLPTREVDNISRNEQRRRICQANPNIPPGKNLPDRLSYMLNRPGQYGNVCIWNEETNTLVIRDRERMLTYIFPQVALSGTLETGFERVMQELCAFGFERIKTGPSSGETMYTHSVFTPTIAPNLIRRVKKQPKSEVVAGAAAAAGSAAVAGAAAAAGTVDNADMPLMCKNWKANMFVANMFFALSNPAAYGDVIGWSPDGTIVLIRDVERAAFLIIGALGRQASHQTGYIARFEATWQEFGFRSIPEAAVRYNVGMAIAHRSMRRGYEHAIRLIKSIGSLDTHKNTSRQPFLQRFSDALADPEYASLISVVDDTTIDITDLTLLAQKLVPHTRNIATIQHYFKSRLKHHGFVLARTGTASYRLTRPTAI